MPPPKPPGDAAPGYEGRSTDRAPERHGRRYPLRPACAWGSCGRDPVVQVEYRPASDHTTLVLVDRVTAVVDLCDAHAVFLRALFGQGRVTKETRLG
jgi:hypothetical protein